MCNESFGVETRGGRGVGRGVWSDGGLDWGKEEYYIRLQKMGREGLGKGHSMQKNSHRIKAVA